MGELFYRVAAVRAVRSASDAARGLLSPHQFGVGVAGGCEHIVHCMQHSLTHIANNRPLAAVKIDISNAFNTSSHASDHDCYQCCRLLGSMPRPDWGGVDASTRPDSTGKSTEHKISRTVCII